MQDTTEPKQAIANAVRAELARRRCTQKKIRSATGWSVSFLARRMAGDVEFSLAELITVSKAIGSDPIDLFRDAVEQVDPQHDSVAA